MDRTPYLGDVAMVVHAGKKETGTPLADTPTRPATRHGGMRDLHESGFSLSGKSGAGAGLLGEDTQVGDPRLLKPHSLPLSFPHTMEASVSCPSS